MRPFRPALLCWRGGLICLLGLPGCSRTAILAPEGPIAAANRTILLDSLAIMLAIVLPTMAAALAFAWWFRAGNARATYRPDFAYSGRLELLVWSIPVLTVLFLSGVIWIGSHQLDPARPLAGRAPALEVQVVSLDWKWLFIYPGLGVATVNRLVIPAGAPVHFSLTSATVMNSFFVPRLGSQIYTMNGMTTELNLQADRPGRYQGMSAHFSGDGFSDMNFAVEAAAPASFAAWVNGARGHGPVLDAPGYAALARQSRAVSPITYGSVQPRLFDAIVAQRLSPASGPAAGRGGPQVSPQGGR